MNPLVTRALIVLGLFGLVGAPAVSLVAFTAAFINHRVYKARLEAERARLRAKKELAYDRATYVGIRGL